MTVLDSVFLETKTNKKETHSTLDKTQFKNKLLYINYYSKAVYINFFRWIW